MFERIHPCYLSVKNMSMRLTPEAALLPQSPAPRPWRLSGADCRGSAFGMNSGDPRRHLIPANYSHNHTKNMRTRILNLDSEMKL